MSTGQESDRNESVEELASEVEVREIDPPAQVQELRLEAVKGACPPPSNLTSSCASLVQ